MASISGISSRIGDFALAIQSAKGTPAAAPTVKAFFAGQPSIQPYITDARFAMTDSSRDPGDPYVSQIGVKGDVPLYAHPELMALLWHLTLGSDADSGSGDPYTHTATCANDLPYFTAWRMVGNQVFEKYTDCKIDTFKIDGQAGQPLMVTLSILGITSTFLTSEESGNALTSTPYLYMDGAGALKVDNTAYPIHVLSFQVSNNLNAFQADNYYVDNLDPQGRDISGSYTVRFGGATAGPQDYRTFFYGNDSGTAQTTGFTTHALDFLFTRVAASRTMEIKLPACKWADVPVHADPGGNVIEVQCAFEAMRNWSGGVEQSIMTAITLDGTATA